MIHVVQLSQTPLRPWRNGGGVTQELLAWPEAADWLVRVSVARIDRDGPFSAFEGVQRWFAVLGGAGVRLQWPGLTHVLTHVLTPASPALHFDGAAAPDCHLLDGPTQDLNLMLRSGSGALCACVPGVDWGADAALRAVFTRVPATLRIAGANHTALAAGTLAWSEQAAGQRWSIEPRSPSDAPGPPAFWLHFNPAPS